MGTTYMLVKFKNPVNPKILSKKTFFFVNRGSASIFVKTIKVFFYLICFVFAKKRLNFSGKSSVF